MGTSRVMFIPRAGQHLSLTFSGGLVVLQWPACDQSASSRSSKLTTMIYNPDDVYIVAADVPTASQEDS